MGDVVVSSINVWLDGELYEETLNRVLDVEIEEDTEGPSSLKMVLDMVPTGTSDASATQRDWDLLDGQFGILKQVTVELGVGPENEAPTAKAILFQGYITAMEPYFGEARVPDSHLEVHALDAGCLMQLEERTIGYSNLSDSDIVKQIYQRYGFGVDVESTPTVRSSSRGPIVQRTTDAELIRWLARRNGYEAYVERKEDAPVKKGAATSTEHIGHFHRPRIKATKQPALELAPSGSPSIRRMRARWESHRPTTILSSHIDENTRRQRNVKLTETRLGKMASTTRAEISKERLTKALPQLKDFGATMRQVEEVPYDQPEVDSLAWNAFQEADFWVECSAVVNGLRYEKILRSRRPVELKGAGKLLDGDWYVRRARHRWHRDTADKKYEIDAELVRNALGGIG